MMHHEPGVLIDAIGVRLTDLGSESLSSARSEDAVMFSLSLHITLKATFIFNDYYMPDMGSEKLVDWVIVSIDINL